MYQPPGSTPCSVTRSPTKGRPDAARAKAAGGGEGAHEQADAKRSWLVAEHDAMAPWLEPDGAQRVVGAPDRLLGSVHPRAPAREPGVGEDEIRRGAGGGVDHDALGRVALDLRASGGAGSGAARRRAVAPGDQHLLPRVERAVVEQAPRRGVVEARPGPRDEERAGKRPVVPVG